MPSATQFCRTSQNIPNQCHLVCWYVDEYNIFLRPLPTENILEPSPASILQDVYLGHAGNYFLFFQICQSFHFAGHPYLLFSLDDLFSYNSLEIYVFVCNLTKYLYYRLHLMIRLDNIHWPLSRVGQLLPHSSHVVNTLRHRVQVVCTTQNCLELNICVKFY